MQRTLVAGAAAAALVAGTVLSTAADRGARAQTPSDYGARWTAAGELRLPEGYREWIFLGSPLTPNALNGGQAGFPEFHNVYLHPDAYAAYRERGEFPTGTVMVKELQLTREGSNPDGSAVEASGRGYFPGAFNGLDVSVKDPGRFPETAGWGFFNFGHHAPPYARAAPAAAADQCAGCHMAAATKDMVFTQFYSILDAR